jgi:MFS family permease
MTAAERNIARQAAGRGHLYALAGAHGALHWALGIFYLLLPFIKSEYGLNYAQTGFLATIVHMSAFAANFPSGFIVDVTGRRTLVQLCSLLLAAAALAWVGIADSYLMVAIAAAMLAMMNTLWHPAAISYLSVSFPTRRGMALSFHTVGASLGDAAAPAAAGILIAAIGWNQTAVLGAVVPAVAGVVIYLLFRESGGREANRRRGGTSHAYLSGLRQLIVEPTVWKVCLLAGFRGTGQAGLRTFLPLYFFAVFTENPFWLGVMLMALQISGAVATPFAGILSDRIGRRPVLIAGILGSAVLVFAMPLVTTLPVFITLVAASGIFIFAVRPVIQSWAMDKAPARLGGSMVSLLFGTQSAFAMLVPIAGGLIADAFGLVYVFYMLAAAILIALAIAGTISEERPATAAAD